MSGCVCVCVCIYKSNHRFNFLNIPSCCENSPPFPLQLPSYSVLALWHAKSADFIFLLPAVRKCPFQGSQFSIWLSKPYLCLDCFSISNKRQRQDYHFTSFHTLSFKWQQFRNFFKNHCVAAFAFIFFEKVDGVKRTVVEFRAQHQQWVRPFPAGPQGWFRSRG